MNAFGDEVTALRARLSAVEAKPAAPVLAARAAPTAAARPAVGAGYGSQASETEPQELTMPFQLEELSFDLITALVPLMPRIKQRDKEIWCYVDLGKVLGPASNQGPLSDRRPPAW